jgi:hypothetical protein
MQHHAPGLRILGPICLFWPQIEPNLGRFAPEFHFCPPIQRTKNAGGTILVIQSVPPTHPIGATHQTYRIRWVAPFVIAPFVIIDGWHCLRFKQNGLQVSYEAVLVRRPVFLHASNPQFDRLEFPPATQSRLLGLPESSDLRYRASQASVGVGRVAFFRSLVARRVKDDSSEFESPAS